MQDKKYLVYLHSIGFTQKDFQLLFDEDTNYKNIYESISYSYLSGLSLGKNKIEKILQNKEKINLKKIDSILEKLSVDIITKYDDKYPQQLENIFHPPYLLYVRGRISSKSIAFVGSRKITDYGKSVVNKIVPGVGKYFAIVSGGAAGCDSWAHKSALKNSNPTIAVFGTGIDVYYPTDNERMFHKIVEAGGALVSIFPIGTPGNPYNFPIRNEIVAGLSQGVVVIEAQKKSGSLITANLALDLGKELFVVPGNIFSTQSIGCNELIQSGAAKIVTSELSILEEYNIRSESKTELKKISFSSAQQEKIYNELLLGKKNIDELHNKLGGDFQELVLQISLLELGAYIKKNIDGNFSIM